MASSSRSDGRAPSELRPLSVSLGELDRADGSGRFSFGSTGALASASGPLESRIRDESPFRATFDVVHRPLEGVGATPSKALINSLEAIFPPLLALGAHPRSLVQLIVQSLSSAPPPNSTGTALVPNEGDDRYHWPKSTQTGSEPSIPSTSQTLTAPMTGIYFASRAACINASTLAFVDAGSLGMKGLTVAVALAYLPPSRSFGEAQSEEETLVLDPTTEEETGAASRHAFGWAFGQGLGSNGDDGEEEAGMVVDGGLSNGGKAAPEAELIWAESEGDFSRNQFEDAMAQSKVACQRIFAFIRGRIEEYHKSRASR